MQTTIHQGEAISSWKKMYKKGLDEVKSVRKRRHVGLKSNGRVEMKESQEKGTERKIFLCAAGSCRQRREDKRYRIMQKNCKEKVSDSHAREE